MLVQLAYMAALYKRCGFKPDLPQVCSCYSTAPVSTEANTSMFYKVIVINFTEKYARIVQGTLVRLHPGNISPFFLVMNPSARKAHVSQK